jgi:hypothetical protein
MSLIRLMVSSWAVVSLVLAFIPGSVTAQPVSDKPTVIHIVLVESHDRLTPTPNLGIVWRHEVEVLMKSGQQIQEHFTDTNIASTLSNKTWKLPDHDNSTSLGDNGTKVVWHVLGPNKLQRIRENEAGDLLMVYTIEILENNKCSIDAKFLIQAGRSRNQGKIAGTDTDATFNNYKVLQATCTIE